MTTTPEDILKQYWGFSHFRPLQEEIITAVLQKKDLLALLPTGGGKSLCFQVPTLLQDGLCLVVSPLIALMKDQVQRLKNLDIPAEAIFSGMPSQAIDQVLNQCIDGKIKFLYVSPERLATQRFQASMTKTNLCLLAIDEAHCITEWGYDFRPAYLNIATFRQQLPPTPVLALTATATPEVQGDILRQLNLPNARTIRGSFAKPNLRYVVRKTDNKFGKILQCLRQISGSVIIYASTRRQTESLAKTLQQTGISATYYHGGLSGEVRDQHQSQWINDEVQVMVATNAFGLGIDKPTVRAVIHYSPPTTLEAYYQEAGRAGRDGKTAYAICLYDGQEATNLPEEVAKNYPPPERIKSVYQHLINYHQVAVGSHALVSRDFDFTDFIQRYQLQAKTTYQTLKTLVQTGFIQWQELQRSQPSQVQLLLSQRELYAFQVAEKHHDLFLKVLLRLYGGNLWHHFHPISEEKIAQAYAQPVKKVTQHLQALDQLGILDYLQKTKKPQLTFLQACHVPQQLPMPWAQLKKRKKIALEKAQQVCHYLCQESTCRAQYILAYFGQYDSPACKTCDRCLQKSPPKPTVPTTTLAQTLLQDLAKGPQEVSTLIRAHPLENEQRLVETIRQLLENQQIRYDDAWRLVLICGKDMS